MKYEHLIFANEIICHFCSLSREHADKQLQIWMQITYLKRPNSHFQYNASFWSIVLIQGYTPPLPFASDCIFQMPRADESLPQTHKSFSNNEAEFLNAKHGQNVMHGYGPPSLPGWNLRAQKSLWLPLNDIAMLFVPQCSLWGSSNYTGLRHGKANSGRTPLHPSVRYHITSWDHCGLRPQAESSTVINLVGFGSMKWE